MIKIYHCKITLLMELNSFFNNLNVIELSSVLAGPLAGSFLAELGAEVIKIENKKTNGDVTRGWKLSTEDASENTSAYFHSANFGKKIIMLDFTNENDYFQLSSLLRNADIVITNFLKSTAEKLKINVDNLKRINPNLIIVQLSAYEYDDEIAGFDLVMQAECGFISMTGTEGILAKMPVAMIDILASHQIKEAILIGLLHKYKNNKGSTHYVSLYKSGISALVNQGTNYLMANHIAKPIGTLHPNIAPYGEIINTKDGKKIMLSIGTDKQFHSLCQLLNIENTEDILTNKNRVLNRGTLWKLINDKSTQLESYEILTCMEKENIPFALIKNIDEVFQHKDALSMVIDNPIDELPNGKYIKSIAFHSQFD
jgi:crotonobetainyl-CoA:carnitine CoA-transferase CaiB-like acyl-CoA transferase